MRGKKKQSRYEWLPHEVRRDHTESVVAYVIVGVSMAAVLGVVLFVAYRGMIS